MKKAFIILITVFPYFLSAQTWNVLASAGKDHSEKSISLEWTLGEIAVQQSHTGSMVLTQGYHQGESMLLSSVMLAADPSALLSVWPNPVNSQLNIFIPPDLDGKILLSMTDIDGKIVSIKMSRAGSTTFIDMNHLMQGIYFLRADNSVTQKTSFSKICKIN
jgi:hypothetical protein